MGLSGLRKYIELRVRLHTAGEVDIYDCLVFITDIMKTKNNLRCVDVSIRNIMCLHFL